MKFYKRAGLYKASNVNFNPDTVQAYSYDWWRFVDVINGKVVFNNYNYSNSTCKHQSKVRSVMSDLGIKIDLFIECPDGLQASDPTKSVSEYYSQKIEKLKEAMARPRSHARKNEERMAEIEYLTKKCVEFKFLVEKGA